LPEVEESVFELNILVLGMIAKTYGSGCPKSPMRHWGHEAPNANVNFEGRTYSVTNARKDGRMGARVTIRQTDTREIIRDFFVDYEDLHTVPVMLKIQPYAHV